MNLKLFPNREFILETFGGVRYAVPKELESIYLSHIEERKGNSKKLLPFLWSF